MPGRTLLVAVAAALAVVVGVLAVRGPARSPPPPAPADTPPVVVEDGNVLRAPEFAPVTSDEDLVIHWVRTLQTGSDEHVAWSVGRLRTAGAEGRRAVRDAAQVAIDSNAALVEQALQFLSAAPDDADVPFARAALACRDPQGVILATRLLGDRPGPDRGATARAISKAALSVPRNVRMEALGALAKIGGDDAAEEALRVIRESPAVDAPAAIGAAAGLRSDRFHAALAAMFATETNLAVRFAAADALVAGGDASPEPWLLSLVRSPPPGPLDYADAALGVLAKLRNAEALAKIGATLADSLAGVPARVMAVRRLESYPIEARRAWLQSAAASRVPGDDEVRVEALDSLVRAGAPGAADTLSRTVREGDDAAATVGALVCGRVRRADTAPALTESLRRKDLTEETRALCLRALVLSGAPDAAETVARAMAADRGPEDEPVSMAHNAGAMLGDANPEFRTALGRQLVRALAGEFGPPAGAGLVALVRAAGLCCGPEASATLAARLEDADPAVRANAALALGYAAGPDTERDLRAAWWRARDAGEREVIATAMERAHFRACQPVR
jgi:hypothetical protein